MSDTDIHSCGYYCDRPACIVAQRNELRDKLFSKEWVGLTDEEVKILTTQNRTDFSRPPYEEFYRAIEAKLKEKNK